MGPVVSEAQQQAAIGAVAQLKPETRVLIEGGTSELVDADAHVGAFVPLTLLGCEDPMSARVVHEVEPFGPVATLMPYDDVLQAVHLADCGGGSLVASCGARQHDAHPVMHEAKR